MEIADVRARAFAMPLNNPSYPLGPLGNVARLP
jgi:acetoacetate decarboxylase